MSCWVSFYKIGDRLYFEKSYYSATVNHLMFKERSPIF
ncbi:hypothetical protein CWATWH8502_80 [Crocosphaera watsonii WH 8502]|uniref:Uncharacterized protein n=4 Tax=Crocosphaera watsonii TaxID=263511 RepID=T2JU03_CROWT|nr:hypothetical protein CWATWH0003_3787 [Crocosphaera watsonii WH 0003]CCQ50713.1 hypothetical protein CWATWH8502_80 [Crocosphaera watsonii WH 8502]CCQ57548.1 hypothetical protein CWATWH0005_3078 [Crocosphaera watsonii WH 0005]CCQ69288.1 hypothetical protein CWATWH0402_2035 [Crocosphaera watsonii WH 0402]